MLQLESSWHGRSVDHVLPYSGQKIAVNSQKPSRITRQKTCCVSESNTSVRVVFANRSGFDAPIGVLMAWEERGSCLNIYQMTNSGRISETFTNYVEKDLLRNVDHALTYIGRQIAVRSQKPSRITRQKTCCTSESNTSVRIVFANRSGFDAPIGVVLAWEERRSCLNIFRMRNHGLRSQKPSRITWQKTCCASESNTSVHVVFVNQSGFDAPIGVVMAWEERGSCLNIYRTTNSGRISETFTNYEAKDLLHKVVLMLQLESSWHGRSVDHVLTYFRQQIVVGSQKPSRITRQKTCCASESNTSVRVLFANRSGFNAPIAVVMAWEERGSCLNIYRMTNSGRISITFTNYEEKDLLRKQKTCCASESNKSVRVVFANRSQFDGPIGVFVAWDERGLCLNIFRITNRGRISKTFTNYEAKDLVRKSVDHVLIYSRQQIAVGSQKPSRITRKNRCCAIESNTSIRVVFANQSGFDAPIDGSQKPSLITRQKTCCVNESNMSVRVVFANRSGFDAPIGVVLAWEERGSCLNIFRSTNRGRISKTFTNYEAKNLLREPNRSVHVVFANRRGFDAPIAVVLPWEERGSCLNIFRSTNRGRILETLTNYEAKHLLRK
ncbi:uncharacterized protein G2W53_041745 [Senna tora]|uniref:Uncharacterized protein n=1 Tax=Senna tora TaxID=362788 RepID=A0A834SSL1_9FABA|nr:uncharacterized protein G2W53_041745 [Senna tora]